MKKLLMINGSSRKGNCSLILKNIEKAVGEKVEVTTIDLRKEKFKDCFGCHSTCNYERGCVQKDDAISGVLQAMIDCDLLIIASPNYFQNISGTLKRFFDRTTPLYKKRLLRDKKTIFVFVGGLKCEITEATVTICANGWARPMKVKWLNTYIFQAADVGKFSQECDYENKMQALEQEVQQELDYLN